MLIQADQPSNIKQCGDCIYNKNHLHLKLLHINYLQECITFELNIKSKLRVIKALYRSRKQSHCKFTKLCSSLDFMLQAKHNFKKFDYSSSCIYLILTFQDNLVIKSSTFLFSS